MKIIFTDELNTVIHEEWNVVVVPHTGDLVLLNEIWTVSQVIWNYKGDHVHVKLDLWDGNKSQISESKEKINISDALEKVNRKITELDKRQKINEKDTKTLKNSLDAVNSRMRIDAHNNKK